MPRFLDRLLDLGPADDPRKVAVGTARAGTRRALVSTPGARVQVARDGRDPEAQLALAWLVRRGIPVELVDGPGLTLDGGPIALAELVARLR